MTRKLLTLALAALAFGATQAATTAWQQSGSEIQYGQDLSIRSNSQGNAFSLAVSFSITSTVETSTKLIHCGHWASGSTQVFLEANNQLRVEKFNNGGTATSTTGITLNETNVLVLTVAYGDGGRPTITANLNGTQLWTMTSSNQAPGFNVNLTANDAWSVNSVAAYNQVLTQEEIDRLVATGSAIWTDPDPDPSVPEPTALALLALGVAGVALRRRVA